MVNVGANDHKTEEKLIKIIRASAQEQEGRSGIGTRSVWIAVMGESRSQLWRLNAAISTAVLPWKCPGWAS